MGGLDGVFKKVGSDEPSKSMTKDNHANDLPLKAGEGIIICPECGGENPENAVFCNLHCGDHVCNKALGEFKYVLEELENKKSKIHYLADKVSAFISHPYFILLHVIWFSFWILANEGYLGPIQHFDEYPYGLLGFILAVEAVFITGFLLISENKQANYSEKRAKLDYEVNVRTYRKLLELEKRLDQLLAEESSEK